MRRENGEVSAIDAIIALYNLRNASLFRDLLESEVRKLKGHEEESSIRRLGYHSVKPIKDHSSLHGCLDQQILFAEDS